eukprot:910335-Rhodomonas_salina.3
MAAILISAAGTDEQDRRRELAFAMFTHSRLGAACSVDLLQLPADIVRAILGICTLRPKRMKT